MCDGWHVSEAAAVVWHGGLHVRAHVGPLIASKRRIMMSGQSIVVHTCGLSHTALAVHSVCSPAGRLGIVGLKTYASQRVVDRRKEKVGCILAMILAGRGPLKMWLGGGCGELRGGVCL